MTKMVYPVILTKANDRYIVSIPDFDIMTQGNDIANAINMARDAMSITSVDMQDDNKKLPVPSALSDIHSSNNDIVTLVDVDIDSYRRMIENKSVKKNCTIPAWLCAKAEQANINFSQTLQEALKHQLNI